MSRLDRGVSSFLDVTDGFGTDGESWAEKDWGVPYCMECGDEAVVLSSGTLRHRLTCPNPDCSAHSETDTALKPWVSRVGLLAAAVLLLAVLASGGIDSLVTVIGFAVGVLLVANRDRINRLVGGSER